MIRSAQLPCRRTMLGLAAVIVLAAQLSSGASLPRPHGAPPAAMTHGLDPGLATIGNAVQRVIVSGGSRVADAVRRAGGRITKDLPIVDGVAADIPASRVRALASDPAVRSVTADREAQYEEYSYDDTTTASNFARTTQATRAWATGNYGAGVGVAVVDTGVSPMPDFGGRLVHGPDLSGEGSTVDSYGHGTVMAGVIAGGGNDSATRTGGAFTGVAPAAHIVAVKVAGRNGVVDVSTMLQAMHWVAAYHDQFNIKVLNLSWGVPSTQRPSVDPLNYAVERLWKAGIVVVVAAGNTGPSAGTVTKPGDDPVIITAGAFNDQGDSDLTNDSVPSWSSRGPTAAGIVKPDIVSPGRTIVSPRSYGSYVEATYPKALISPSYIKGSGTSQAAAVTSGLVALLLAARPNLTPDQVKELLTTTALPIAGIDRNIQGSGRVQLESALAATPVAPPQVPVATGLGSIESSRGGLHVSATCNGVTTTISGEIDVRCEAWDPVTWTSSDWNGDAWTGVSWAGSSWTGVSWQDVAWSTATWNGVSWQGGLWTSGPWSGSAWTANAASTSWTGVSWAGSSWTGVSWQDTTWTTGDWTTGEYDEFQTAFWGSVPPPGKYLAGEPYEALPTRLEDLPLLAPVDAVPASAPVPVSYRMRVA